MSRNKNRNKNNKNIQTKETFPEISNSSNKLEELSKNIEALEVKQSVEKIYLNVLEQNVLEEKKKYENILLSEIEIISEFQKKASTQAYLELEKAFTEAESLRQHYSLELKNLDILIAQKKEELNKKNLNLELKYEKKEDFLEKEYNKKDTKLEAIKKECELEISKTTELRAKLDGIYEDLHKKLEAEYSQKEQDLEEKFNKKENNLLSKINIRSTECDKKIETKKQEFDSYIITKKEELKLEKEENERYIELKKKELDEYILSENEKLKKKQQEVDDYKETITKKVDEQIEDKRQAFIDEMIYINSDYKNNLDKQSWTLEKQKSEFKNKAKQKELEILKSTKEYEERVDSFNKEVEHFNNDKITFLNQHHWLHLTKRKIKEHLFGSLIGLLFIMIFSFAFLYTNEYKFFKNNFIGASINRYLKQESTQSAYSFSLDTKNSVLTKFTELNGLNVDVDTSKNKPFSENYEKIVLNSGENNFIFERFYKNNNLIAKTSSFGQYILYDDMESLGYTYNEDEFNKAILDSLKRSISKNKNRNYTDLSKINSTGNNNFIEFLNSSLLLSKDYEYFYTIENNDTILFKDIFTNILNNKNYTSFMLEESAISEKLLNENEFKTIEEIINGIIENSSVKNNIINLKISQNLELSNIDMTFNLEYKDSTMASSVPLTVKVRCSLETITKDVSLENPQFKMNSVKFENLVKKD